MSTAAHALGLRRSGPQAFAADAFRIPPPPRQVAARRSRRPAWREAMAGALAGLVLSLLVGEFLLLLHFGW